MPRATTAKAKPKPRRPAAKVRAKTSAKRRRSVRMLNGIPLKRTVMWVYDTDSPQFKAAWKKERAVLRKSSVDPEIDEFLDDAWRDIDRSLGRE
jgi:hypothetical protein